MKSLFSYFIVFCAVIFWIFRIVVALMYSMQKEFICVPLNGTLEILILFLTIPCILVVIRRNFVGALLYFGMYAAYFGTILYNDLTQILSETGNVLLTSGTTVMADALGVVIPFLVFADIAIQKSGFNPDKFNADWYYENEKYDRQFDERADRNEYKIK